MALPFDIKKNPTFVGMQAGERVITQIVQGRKTLGLIGGGSAVGKTYKVRSIARRHGIKQVIERRPDNAEAMVQIVYLYRDHPFIGTQRMRSLVPK